MRRMGRSKGAWSDAIGDARDRLTQMSGALNAIGEQVILPAYGRRYRASGLKDRSGGAFRALTQKGAAGNYFQVHGNTLICGVDETLWNRYLKYPVMGHQSTRIRVKKAKALKIRIGGMTIIFRKSVRGTKPHPSAAPGNYQPSGGEQALIAEAMAKHLFAGDQFRFRVG